MNKRNKTTNTTCYFLDRWAPYVELWQEETNSSPASMPPAVLGERVWTRPSEAPIRHTEICKQPWTSDEEPSGRAGDVSSRQRESQRWLGKELEKMDSCVQQLEKHPVSTLRWSGGGIKTESVPILVQVSGKLWGGTGFLSCAWVLCPVELAGRGRSYKALDRYLELLIMPS